MEGYFLSLVEGTYLASRCSLRFGFAMVSMRRLRTRGGRRSSSTRKHTSKYLKKRLYKKNVRLLCDTLRVDYTQNTTTKEMLQRLEKERPDLMRGSDWNMLRGLFSTIDFTTKRNGIWWKNILWAPAFLSRAFGEKTGLSKAMGFTGTGATMFAKERAQAHELLNTLEDLPP